MAESTEIIYTDDSTADPSVKMPAHAHREGCPARRLERYKARAPEDQGSTLYEVTHCLDCGVLQHKQLKGE